MLSPISHLFPIDELSRVGEARRVALRLLADARASEEISGRAALIVSELASNLAKHAREGKLALILHQESGSCFDLIAFDSGPGMDLERCLRDGFSTAGTPGTGLGALQRLSDEFSIFSVPGKGSVCFARCNLGVISTNQWKVGVLALPATAEIVSGDGWVVRELLDRVRVMVVDGLGHGPIACIAADAAVKVFSAADRLSLPEVLAAQHQELRGTRGAAITLAEIRIKESKVSVVGVGNVSATVLGRGTARGALAQPGIVGHEMRKLHPIEYDWPESGTLVLHSDGINNRWSMANYPGLTGKHPALLAGTIFRDGARGRDDATVLCLSQNRL